ncbi:MAG: hypothetical protein ACD_23C00078G0004 [uncultured bacterium]|nr:MAG: hypothetical protein ACD_23C00078G0004 [uncultured bacterium]
MQNKSMLISKESGKSVGAVDEQAGYLIFPEGEYATRLNNVRRDMAAQNIDACLITVPENIYYLAGLDHWGFFAYHVLIVPKEGEMVLIARAMEQVTMDNQIAPRARFVGYKDFEDPAEITAGVLKGMGVSKDVLGLEKHSVYQPLKVVEGIKAICPDAAWVDIGLMVDLLRRIKSPIEQIYARQAANVSDAMMQAAIAAVHSGANEREIAAETYRAMVLAGGEYPSFGPFIRPTSRLGEEHTTWGNSILKKGDALFLEMSGCVRRYHAPMGRIVYIGEAPEGTKEIERVCLAAFDAVVSTIRPGVTANTVYKSWQDQVDSAGLSHYQRHHCGYMVGSSFPPGWCGVGVPVGLRKGSELELKEGMTFHLLSWLMGTGRGDYFISNTVLVNETGCEVLTNQTPRELKVV